jgi:hypothetical protein
MPYFEYFSGLAEQVGLPLDQVIGTELFLPGFEINFSISSSTSLLPKLLGSWSDPFCAPSSERLQAAPPRFDHGDCDGAVLY